MRQDLFLNGLKTVRPTYEKSQEDAIHWLAEAHATADKFAPRSTSQNQLSSESYGRLIKRFGCSPERIANRGHELADFNHFDWDRMQIFKLAESPTGLPMDTRQRIFDELVSKKCESLFPDGCDLSPDLIHVTCTGYVSPSPLQRLVVERGSAHKTRVTHAYHMGCYAALPAVRMASGFCLQQQNSNLTQKRVGVDVVHTELCTLHFNPMDHSPEQLVVQSLFADGFVRYRVGTEPSETGRSFRILAMDEWQIPGSAEAMTWIPTHWGMSMTLSRDVPALIGQSLKAYISALFEKAGVSPADVLPNLIYAVHPGGPKIIDQVQQLLEISEDKISASKSVLRRYGNMSSATLPHIWNEILERENHHPVGSYVLSLAFGPGLTIAGNLMEIV